MGSKLSLLICLGGMIAARPGMTQEPARIRGVVVVGSGAPIKDADVTLDGTLLRKTNDQGRFAYDSVTPGPHRLTVRAIGYRPLTATLALKAGTADATITLSSDPYRLPELAVRARRPHLERMGFYTRRQEERRGRFIEGDSLQRLDSLDLVLALSRLWGFRLRDAATAQPDIASRFCKKGFRLWVNGWEIDSLDEAFYLRTIDPDEVDGLEIYEEGTPPLVFSGPVPRSCVLAIWER